MKGEIDQISAKIQTLEVNQETSHKENIATHTRLDDMAVKVKEIRLLTGVRYSHTSVYLSFNIYHHHYNL